MKGLAIINPDSGTQTVQQDAMDSIALMLKKGVAEEIHVYFTHGQYDATNRAKAVRPGEYDFILAVGGDGTVGETIAGIVEGGSGTPMAVIAAGTTNDFATIMGLPSTPPEVCDMIAGMKTVKCDVGLMNDRYFLNVAAGGQLSEVAHNVTSDMKTAFGRLAYFIAGAMDLGSLKLDTTKLHFTLSGVKGHRGKMEFDEDVYLFAMVNTSRSGNFNKIAPLAKVDDGLLDLVIVKKLEPLDIVPIALRMQSGTHLEMPQIRYYQCREAHISCADPESSGFPVDYDGENGGALPVHLKALPGAVRIIVSEVNTELVSKG